MAISKRRSTFIGSILWVLCIQYYVVQVIVAMAWKIPYSIAQNTISDLGNTVCGAYGGRFVCSPLHGLMNFSFAVLGILMVAGSILISHSFHKSLAMRAAFSFIVIAGLGTSLVGIFPENTLRTFHIVGAALPFVVGNLGLLWFGFIPRISRALNYCALIFGLVSLLALILFVTHHYVGIGIGGTERLVAYPQTVWLIIFGVYQLCEYLHYQHRMPLQ